MLADRTRGEQVDPAEFSAIVRQRSSMERGTTRGARWSTLCPPPGTKQPHEHDDPNGCHPVDSNDSKGVCSAALSPTCSVHSEPAKYRTGDGCERAARGLPCSLLAPSLSLWMPVRFD